MEEITGMLLAAGRGERLKPLTDFVPKPLLIVGGLPLILRGILMMRSTGIRKIVVNLHHLGEEIRRFLEDGRRWDVSIIYSEEEELLGTGGGVKKALPFLSSKTVCIMNTDILCDVNLTDVLMFHRKKDAPVTIVVKKGGRDLSLRGELVEDFFPSGDDFFTFCGISFVEREILYHLPDGKSCLVRDLFLPLLKSGVTISAYIHTGFFLDVGSPEGLKIASRLGEAVNG